MPKTTVVFEQTSAGLNCDFCNAPNPTERYHAKDVELSLLGNLTHTSRGDWAACEDCAQLIDAGSWNGLVSRVLEMEGLTFGTLEYRVIEALLVSAYNRLRQPEVEFHKICKGQGEENLPQMKNETETVTETANYTPNSPEQYYCSKCGKPIPDVGEKCTDQFCDSNLTPEQRKSKELMLKAGLNPQRTREFSARLFALREEMGVDIAEVMLVCREIAEVIESKVREETLEMLMSMAKDGTLEQATGGMAKAKFARISGGPGEEPTITNMDGTPVTGIPQEVLDEVKADHKRTIQEKVDRQAGEIAGWGKFVQKSGGQA